MMLNTDTGTSAPLWALMQIHKAPTAALMHSGGSAGSGLLFNNATEDNLITNVTVGLFNYKDAETQSGKVAHVGWILKTTGTDGRASRIQYETLACLTNSADA